MDVSVGEEYFYDTFKLNLTGLHALIAEDDTQWTNLKVLVCNAVEKDSGAASKYREKCDQ